MLTLMIIVFLARLMFRPWGFCRPFGMFLGMPFRMHRPPMGGFGPGFGGSHMGGPHGFGGAGRL